MNKFDFPCRLSCTSFAPPPRPPRSSLVFVLFQFSGSLTSRHRGFYDRWRLFNRLCVEAVDWLLLISTLSLLRSDLFSFALCLNWLPLLCCVFPQFYMAAGAWLSSGCCSTSCSWVQLMYRRASTEPMLGYDKVTGGFHFKPPSKLPSWPQQQKNNWRGRIVQWRVIEELLVFGC